MKAPEPGIYVGIPFDEYLQWDALNNTLLRIIEKQSPAHAKAHMEYPPEPSPVFEFGQGLHCLALEPDEFDKRYSVAPICDRRTKVGKETWSKFQESLDGKKAITNDDFEQMKLMAEAIKRQAIHRFIEKGEAEVCIVWIDNESGLLCKARIDYLHRNHAILIDLKSSADASPDAFSKAIYNYGYYQQAGWYCDGWKTLTGDEPAFVFLASEKGVPYAVAAYEMADEVVVAGRKAYRNAISIYQQCLKNNYWPGYSDKVEMLSLPTWALNKIGMSKYNMEAYNG
jgi:exodeoxyribonuclease VIII